MMIVFVFFTVVFSCVPRGSSCFSTSDCCPSLCSPTSCLISLGIGTCIGSTCNPYGTVCNLDCECCSGDCVINDLNFGTCGTDTKSLAEVDECGISCVNCRWSNRDCNICCPIGVQAWCAGGACHCGPGYEIVTQTQSSNITVHYAVATSGTKHKHDNTLLIVSILTGILTFVIVVQFLIIIRSRNRIAVGEENRLVRMQ